MLVRHQDKKGTCHMSSRRHVFLLLLLLWHMYTHRCSAAEGVPPRVYDDRQRNQKSPGVYCSLRSCMRWCLLHACLVGI
jgi:hypothetical protein